MIGYRQLLVILCSMFLMLGIGILLGAVANFTPEANKQQEATVKKLTQNLDIITADSDRDELRLQGNEQAIGEIAPMYVGSVLAGKRFAIVQTGDYSSAVRDAATAITAAGGSIASVSVVTSRMTEMDNVRIDRVAASLMLSQYTTGTADTDIAHILRPLVLALHVGTSNLQSADTDLNTLTQDGLINESGDYTLPVSGVVVVAGESDDAGSSAQSPSATSQIDQALLSDFADIAPHLSVVGCEPYDAVQSSLPDFTAAGISSVDCIDLPLGGLDLPYALRDDSGVAYGLKSTAALRTPAQLSENGTLKVPKPVPTVNHPTPR